MHKGTYTFHDRTAVTVYYDPKRSDNKSVYVEWYGNHVKHTMWLPSEGLTFKK